MQTFQTQLSLFDIINTGCELLMYEDEKKKKASAFSHSVLLNLISYLCEVIAKYREEHAQVCTTSIALQIE